MKEPVSVSVSIQTDKDTRKSMDHVSEQERQEPLCLSCLGIPFRHSRNTANLRVFCVRGIIILISRLKRIQRHCRAVTSYSESVILSDMVGTSRHTATIRPTEQEHPTRTPERAWIRYRNRAGTSSRCILLHQAADTRQAFTK